MEKMVLFRHVSVICLGILNFGSRLVKNNMTIQTMDCTLTVTTGNWP
jgi:hypothetical protein